MTTGSTTGGSGGSGGMASGGSGGSGSATWSKGQGVNGDTGWSIAVDASDNVIVAGTFQGSIDFGAGPLVSGGNGSNAFVVKLTNGGDVIWQKGFACTSNSGVQGFSAAVDSAGNIALTGNFAGKMNIAGAVLSASGNSPDNRDGYLAMLDSQGNELWSRRFGDSSDADAGNGVAFDPSGNVLLTGGVTGQVDFGKGVVDCSAAQNIFVAKYTAQGTPVFATCLGQAGIAFRAVASDPAGNILLAGSYNGSLLIGGTVLSGQHDMYVAKLSPAGSAIWAKSFGDKNPMFEQDASDVKADANGNLFIVGRFRNDLDMGGGSLPAPSTQATVVVAKLDPSGKHLWSHSYGAAGAYSSGARGVALDAKGNLLITGGYQGPIDFGGGALTFSGSGDVDDVFVLKLTSEGAHLSSQGFGDPANQTGFSCAFDSLGDRLITGRYASTIDFGNGDLPTVANVTSSGIFVAKLAP